MAKTAQEIADEVLAAHEVSLEAAADALGAYFADKVAIVSNAAHEMPSMSDDIESGTSAAGDVLREGRHNELAAFRRSMDDFHEDIDIEVDGDDMIVSYTITGTLSDGSPLKATVPAAYTVKDGEIAQVGLRYPEGATDVLFKALAEGGFQPPALG
jgi:ketosteroid isomerase-like protein